MFDALTSKALTTDARLLDKALQHTTDERLLESAVKMLHERHVAITPKQRALVSHLRESKAKALREKTALSSKSAPWSSELPETVDLVDGAELSHEHPTRVPRPLPPLPLPRAKDAKDTNGSRLRQLVTHWHSALNAGEMEKVPWTERLQISRAPSRVDCLTILLSALARPLGHGRSGGGGVAEAEKGEERDAKGTETGGELEVHFEEGYRRAVPVAVLSVLGPAWFQLVVPTSGCRRVRIGARVFVGTPQRARRHPIDLPRATYPLVRSGGQR